MLPKRDREAWAELRLSQVGQPRIDLAGQADLARSAWETCDAERVCAEQIGGG
jgi:hypothetical protein